MSNFDILKEEVQNAEFMFLISYKTHNAAANTEHGCLVNTEEVWNKTYSIMYIKASL